MGQNIFDKAEAYLGAGNYKAAKKKYEACISTDLKPAESYARLASLMLREERIFEARSYNKKSLRLAQNILEALYNQAYLAKKFGDYAAAKKIAKKAYRLAPDSPDLLLLIAEIEKRMGSYSRAESVLKQLVKKDNDSAITAAIALAELYQEQGEYDKSTAVLNRAQSIDPANRKINGLVTAISELRKSLLKIERIENEVIEGGLDMQSMYEWQQMYHKAIHIRPNGGFHVSMLNDNKRNEAFLKAIKNKVSVSTQVLDIGAGSGLLALMAVQSGAEKVTACEFSPHMRFMAEKTIRDNGAEDKIKLIFGDAFSLNLEKVGYKPDIILMELIGDAVVGEKMLPILNTLHYTGLLDNSDIIPCRAVLKAVPIKSSALESDAHLERAEIFGLDMGFYQESTCLEGVLQLARKPRKYLPAYEVVGNEVVLFDFDFRKKNPLVANCDVELEVSCDTAVLGVLVYFDLYLDETTVYTSNSDSSCWTNDIWFYKQSINVQHGSVISLSAEYNHDKFRVSSLLIK